MFRTIGAMDALLSILGLCLMVDPIIHGLFSLSADSQYFRIAFVTMTVFNGVFLVFYSLAAVQLLRLKKSGVTVHVIASVLLVSYDLTIGVFWAVRGPVGMSVAAATGIGNMGIAPFQCFNFAPYVYPIVSTVVILVTVRKVAGAFQVSRGHLS